MLTESKPPRSIGSLRADGDELSAYLFFPTERAALLAAVIQSGRIQIVHITASPIKYRAASIINFSMDTEFREEDW